VFVAVYSGVFVEVGFVVCGVGESILLQEFNTTEVRLINIVFRKSLRFIFILIALLLMKSINQFHLFPEFDLLDFIQLNPNDIQDT